MKMEDINFDKFALNFFSFLLLVLLATPTIQEEDENGPVYLEEDFITISTKMPLSVPCYTEFNLTSTARSLVWFDANATDVNAYNDSRRYYTTDGELHIDPLYVSDSGEYVCALVTTGTTSTSNDNNGLASPSSAQDNFYHEYNATLVLNVYIMPDYFSAGLVLVCINFALCALFIACLVYSHFKQKEYEKKLKEETMKVQNPAVKELKMYA